MPTPSFNLRFSSLYSLAFTLLLYISPPEEAVHQPLLYYLNKPRFSQCLLVQHATHRPPDRPASPSVSLLQVQLIFLQRECRTPFSVRFLKTSKHLVNTFFPW